MSPNSENTIAKAYLEPQEVDKLEKAATNIQDRLLISNFAEDGLGGVQRL